jgi:murein DD-endopeptidase MepM/ murein hydrolase activator NlpD
MQRGNQRVTGTKRSARSVRGRSFARRPAALLLGGALTFSVLPIASAPVASAEDGQEEIAKKVDEASDDLTNANEAVAEAAQVLNEAKALLPPAQSLLDQALAREAAAQQARVAAVAALDKANAELSAAQQRSAAVAAQFEQLRSSLGDFARRAYQMGPFGEIEMVLDAEDPADFTDRLSAIRSVSQSSNAQLGDLAANRAQMRALATRTAALQELAQEQKQIAEQKLAEAEAARAEAAAAKAAVDELIAAQNSALATAESQRTAVQNQYQALRAEQERIARAAQEAAELARRAAAAAAGGSPAWSSADGFFWPIPGGGLTQGSGPRIHPVYGYRSCHTGIDVRGGYGTPIRAVQSGVVALIQSGGPYGLHTLIAHGDRVSSFYAHQSRSVVAVGQLVKQGDVIGYVGSTGWVTGPHLHFEMHVDGQPYDPMGWFGGAKTAIRC